MKQFDYLELQMLDEYREIFKRYNISLDVEALESIKEKVVNKDYVVSIIGSMKAGKSTFVNSILGKDLMPSENAACTLTTTEIVDSKIEFSLEKIYDDGEITKISTENISEDFHNEIRMSRENKEEKLFKYSLKTNIEAIENDLCDIGFKLVDTPGYNEMSGLGVDRKIIEDVFERQIKKTDYIIYVLDYKY
ncbi:MAG: dynamin family protein, partial [Clostridium sp.]